MHGPGLPAAGGLTLSVHGPAGVLDLLAPPSSRIADLAEEYAAHVGLAEAPALHSRTGELLRPEATLGAAGVGQGSVLVAASSVAAQRSPAGVEDTTPVRAPDGLALLWFAVAAAAAVAAGWAVGDGAAGPTRTTAVALLVVGALVGVVPVGRFATHRAVTAPAFGAGAALAVGHGLDGDTAPVVIGLAALAAAVTAGVARALAPRAEEELRVWATAGAVVFAATTLAVLVGVPAPATWAGLLVASMLAARFVPALAVDVPDELLLDLDRLAVTAWSARERPRRRRARVASPEGVEAVVRRASRLVRAACAAITVVALVSAAQLLASVTVDLDRIGARCVVLFAGAALLLAGRSYRHAASRALLRLAGAGCWAVLVADAVPDLTAGQLVAAASFVVLLAGGLVVVAVATGRGWRSVWWARRAEVAEGVTGAAALASVLVAGGLFRVVWELGSRIST